VEAVEGERDDRVLALFECASNDCLRAHAVLRVCDRLSEKIGSAAVHNNGVVRALALVACRLHYSVKSDPFVGLVLCRILFNQNNNRYTLKIGLIYSERMA